MLTVGNSDRHSSSALQAVLALNLVTVLWGSQHAVIKGLVDATASPDIVNAARFDGELPTCLHPRAASPRADARRVGNATVAALLLEALQLLEPGVPLVEHVGPPRLALVWARKGRSLR